MTPHKYADVIKAWADGKDVQFRASSGSYRIWRTYNCSTDGFLNWVAAGEWRIKPDVRKFRVALVGNGSYPLAIDNKEAEKACQGRDDFVKWLTDWVEYELS